MHTAMLSLLSFVVICHASRRVVSAARINQEKIGALEHAEVDGKIEAKTSLPPSAFAVMAHRGQSIIDGVQRSNACEGLDREYKIPPLERAPLSAQLTSFCQSTWPEFDNISNTVPRSTLQTTCTWNYWARKDLNLAESLTTEPIMIPYEDELVEYKWKKTLSGGANNMGLFVIEKAALGAGPESLPETLVLKIGTQKDFAAESACMKGTAGIKGLPMLYSDAFKFKDTCYKALVMDLVPGKLWGDVMPLDADSECQLQESAGRLMCGVASRGFVEMDWNNPGNWMVDEHGEFSRIDMGFCWKAWGIGSLEHISYRLYQVYHALDDNETGATGLSTMWHTSITNRWRNGESNLGVGDLVLNSQERVDALKEITAGRASVSFPGTYVSQLGGKDWHPNDLKCQATRSSDLTTFTLKLDGLEPGEYEFKAMMYPEKHDWTNSYGADDGGNFVLRIESGKGTATLVFDAIKKKLKIEQN